MDVQKKKETKSAALLSITALIWGVAFIFQRTGMEHIGPFAFNFFRCLICTIFLFLVSRITDRRFIKAGAKPTKLMDRTVIIGGVIIGTVLFLAMGTQQVGMVTTTAAKSGFITTMYIVLVPLMGIFYGRKTTVKTWVCVVVACIGLYLLSIKNGFTIEKGDFFVFLSAIFFGLQIVVVDIFAPKTDPIKLSLVEFITSGILALIVMLFKENITLDALQAAIPSLIFTGLFSSGIGFTFQMIAQRNIQPSIASLIMSSESVISMIAGVMILGESMTGREYLGSLFMVIAILLAQIEIPVRYKKTA
ncbi:DMT family transporter [Peptostreptococcus equinus]|uniref:DMT family transporter n=1 Tax=Peptostreptococcus equinus TaxID=3003601 RepID=A0ABY7JQ27_9FIRM|nr:DMT family transporter [Peptostreptococcus sp. CBA3647]WAW14273.1 DMT family transporter [Peptostreptococcus sp. CBA3647]